MLTRVGKIKINLCSLAILFVCVHSLGLAGEVEPQLTKEQLTEAYSQINDKDRAVIDKWTAEQRDKFIKTHALVSAIQKQEKADKERADALAAQHELQAKQTVVKIPDKELLEEAYQSYINDDIPNATAIRLFEQYLVAHPDTPFAAEINFYIGAMYSCNRKQKFNEEFDRDNMIAFYRRA